MNLTGIKYQHNVESNKKETIKEIDDLIDYVLSIENMPWYATKPIVDKLQKVKDKVKKI